MKKKLKSLPALSGVDLSLTRQHFSTKCYKSYFHYIQKHHPDVSLGELCEQAGLPYEYMVNENNWVSSVFDNRITKLMIERTGEPNLCYKAGEQLVSEEVMGRVVYFLMRYTISIQFVISQLGQLTALFNTVTKVHTVASRKGFIHLRLEIAPHGLTEEELKALKANLGNIFQNTIGHYAAVPSCQDLPAAQIETKEWKDEQGNPVYDIYINFVSSWKNLETLALLLTILACVAIEDVAARAFPEKSGSIRWGLGVFFLGISLVTVLSKYLGLKRGFHLSLDSSLLSGSELSIKL